MAILFLLLIPFVLMVLVNGGTLLYTYIQYQKAVERLIRDRTEP